MQIDKSQTIGNSSTKYTWSSIFSIDENDYQECLEWTRHYYQNITPENYSGIINCVKYAIENGNHSAFAHFFLQDKYDQKSVFCEQLKALIKQQEEKTKDRDANIDSAIKKNSKSYIEKLWMEAPIMKYWRSLNSDKYPLKDTIDSKLTYTEGGKNKWRKGESLPPRDVIVQIGIILSLTPDETNSLLLAAGEPVLYVLDVVDVSYRYHSSKEMIKELQSLRKIVSYCKTCDYSEATSAAFDLLVPVAEVCRLPMKYNHFNFREAVTQLDSNLHINNVDIYRCKYQFQIYWTMINKQMDINLPDGRTMSNLLRSGILCCNNTGDHALGDTLRKKLEIYKEFLSVPEYLNLQLNLAEQENDKLEYISASERVARTISCLEIIENTYKKCSKIMGQSEASAKTKELGRTYSANGRYLSFLSAERTGNEQNMKAAEAESFFRKALDEFKDDTGNKEITMCHILHLAVEYNNIALFKEFSPLYFGALIKIDIESCLQSILTDEQVDVFKLFVFIKCLNQFLPNRINSSILTALDAFVENSRKPGFPRSPFIPLIYRHIGCMMYRNKGSMNEDIKKIFVESITYFESTSFEGNSPISIITVMAYQTWAIYNELAGIEDDNQTLKDMLITQSRNSDWNTLENLVEKGRPLTKLLRYEYA